MKKVKINETFYVPDGNICNYLDHDYEPSSQLCRFCVHDKKGYRCALFYNAGLAADKRRVYKCGFCKGEDAPLVEQRESPAINVKKLISDVLKEVLRAYREYCKQGLPEDLAVKQAAEYVKDRYK